MAVGGVDLRRGAVVVGARRLARPGPRLAAGRRRRRGARPAARPGAARSPSAAGLTAAVYLPLVLHSALPDSTMPFAALALGACLLMTRIARDPRGARLADPRVIGLGVLIGLAALTRNEALWLGLAWAIVAWRAGGLDRAARLRLIGVAGVVAVRGLRPVGMARLGGVRQPAARPGGDQRPVGDRLRHLRLERPADPRPLPRGRAGPAGGDAGRGRRPQPVLASCCCRACRSRSSASSPCRGRAATPPSGRSSCCR